MLIVPENFRITSKDGQHLISPEIAVGNYAWSDWTHRWLRSMHVDDHGCILSVGFPKFMNLNEGKGKYKITLADLLSYKGDLRATLKVDGRLLIRYVKNGKVMWRTRGSLSVGLKIAYEIDQFCEENPKLKDPSLYTYDSILFEWVSPNDQIVIEYGDPRITLIGGVKYKNGVHWSNADISLFTHEDLVEAAVALDANMVDSVSITSNDVNSLLKQLEGETKIEGYVVRFDNFQQMVKIKAKHYIVLHALKSHLSISKLIDLWASWEYPDRDTFNDMFEAAYDFECLNWASSYIDRVYDAIARFSSQKAFVCAFVEDHKHEDRKTFALNTQSSIEETWVRVCYMMYDGKEITEKIIKDIVYDYVHDKVISCIGVQ